MAKSKGVSLELVGYTTQGKKVLKNVYRFYETVGGLDFADLFFFIQERDSLVSWIHFYEEAKANGMKHERILSRIKEPVIDVWGAEYWKGLEVGLNAFVKLDRSADELYTNHVASFKEPFEGVEEKLDQYRQQIETKHAESISTSQPKPFASWLSEYEAHPIVELATAIRRAKFFTKDIVWSGESEPIATTGLAIPVRNWLWMYNGSGKPKHLSTEEDAKQDLACLFFMAHSINKWIDSHLVENDDDAKAALVSFLGVATKYADFDKLAATLK